jgi:hypothetical protein
VQTRIETEDYAMSLIGNRRDFLSALLSALLALALFGHGAATAQEVKQIKLNDKHIRGFMAAYEDIAKVYDGAESDKPEDPKVEALAAAVAKKHGFASLAHTPRLRERPKEVEKEQPPDYSHAPPATPRKDATVKLRDRHFSRFLNCGLA